MRAIRIDIELLLLILNMVDNDGKEVGCFLFAYHSHLQPNANSLAAIGVRACSTVNPDQKE